MRARHLVGVAGIAFLGISLLGGRDPEDSSWKGTSALPTSTERRCPDRVSRGDPPAESGGPGKPAASGGTKGAMRAERSRGRPKAPPTPPGTPEAADSACLRGRVLHDGEPAGGVLVVLRSAGRTATIQLRTDAAGMYETRIDERADYTIGAISTRNGLDAITSLRLEPGTETEAPDLVLQGPERVRGTVVYPDGRPAWGIEIALFPEWATPRAGVDPLSLLSLPEDLVGRSGLPGGTGRTDDEGRFEIRALEPGMYHLLAPRVTGRVHRAPELVATGPALVQLVIEHYRLFADVRRRDGDPVLATVVLDRIEPPGPCLVQPSGWIALWPGTWRLRIEAKGCVPEEREVVIGPTDYERSEEFVLLELPPPPLRPVTRLEACTLRIAIPGLAQDRHVIRLEALPGGRRRERPDRDGRFPPLPPGRYRVRVEDPGSEFAIPIEATVELVPGQETVVGGRLEEGGVLEFHPAGDRDPPARIVARPRGAGEPVTLARAAGGSGWRAILRPGVYDVEVDGVSTSRPVLVDPGRRTIVDSRP